MRIALPPQISMEALADRDPAAQIADLGGETMGTTWQARLAIPPGRAIAPIRSAIVARLAGLVAEMSQWEPDSSLSRFNWAAVGEWQVLPPDFATVVAAALDLARLTSGAFDPTIGRLVDLHGFGPEGRSVLADAAAIAAARGATGWQRLAFDRAARRLRQPGDLALDLSGIAKGYAVDAVAALLQAAGIRHHLVEIGGELAGSGIRPDGDPWWVELESSPGCLLPPLRIALHGIAAATSGDYRRGAHTIDPRTGRPVDNGVASVSVVHGSAMFADAWATALTVLGPDEGVALATSHGIAARFIARDRQATLEHLTPAFASMLHE